jgi:predicted lipoprotein with Yx(FWY)xxD motif
MRTQRSTIMISRARIGFLATAAAIPLAAAGIGACGSSGGNQAAAPTAPKTASGQAATVGLENDGSLGKVLVDSNGRTLYLFQKDSGAMSACAAACAAAWPPLPANGKSVVGTGLTASKLGRTTRSDGKPQVTYNGHPLYRYTGDSKPGDTNGQGLTAFGAAWFALSGAGNVVSRPGSNPNPGAGY